MVSGYNLFAKAIKPDIPVDEYKKIFISSRGTPYSGFAGPIKERWLALTESERHEWEKKANVMRKNLPVGWEQDGAFYVNHDLGVYSSGRVWDMEDIRGPRLKRKACN